MFIIFQMRQSDPPSEIEYAIHFPSGLMLVPPKENVPSSENEFGSINTSASHSSRQSFIINLLCCQSPSLK